MRHRHTATLRLALCTALLALAGTAAQAVEDCDVNGQSVNPANGNTTKDKTGIMRCKDRDSGVVVREQELRAGRFEGLVRYYKDGKLQREFSVNDKGNREGRAREFAPDGTTVVLDETLRNGSTVGLVRAWYPDGTPRRVAWVGDEQPQPAQQRERASVQYTRKGQLSELVCGPRPLLAPWVDDATLCGFNGKAATVETYAENGTLRAANTWLAGANIKSVGYHANGKPASVDEVQGPQRVQQQFSADGVKLKEVLWRLKTDTQPSLKLRERDYAEGSGTLVREQTFALVDVAGQPQNRLVEDVRFFLNGQPKSKDSYSLDGRTELHDAQRFHDNGQLAAQGRHVVEGRYREKPVGVHQQFSEQGRLVAENTYNDKGQIQRERAWDASGQLLRDDAVFEDGSRKAFAK